MKIVVPIHDRETITNLDRIEGLIKTKQDAGTIVYTGAWVLMQGAISLLGRNESYIVLDQTIPDGTTCIYRGNQRCRVTLTEGSQTGNRANELYDLTIFMGSKEVKGASGAEILTIKESQN